MNKIRISSNEVLKMLLKRIKEVEVKYNTKTKENSKEEKNHCSIKQSSKDKLVCADIRIEKMRCVLRID